MTTCVRLLHVKFGVAPTSVLEEDTFSLSSGFLGFFIEEIVFVMKINDITTSQGRRSFLLQPGTIEPSLVSI